MAQSLASVEKVLNWWLKPKVFGESWDNIGLLVGSGRFSKENKVITGILVCNDLKPAVLDEAISKNANLVVAYHPPIFSGMKSIAYGSWKEQLIAKCLAHDISVYSPHTTLDCVAGGNTDAVIEALAEFGSMDMPLKSKAIIPSSILGNSTKKGLSYTSSFDNISSLCHQLSDNSYPDVAIELDADSKMGTASVKFFSNLESSSGIDEIKRVASSSKILEFASPLEITPPAFGAGRLVTFPKPVEFNRLIETVKVGLKLDYVQVGFAGKSEVKSVAVCVGSGSSLLKGVSADVFITGEMSHHAILDSTLEGTSVILCNHCSSERHYLPKLASIVKLLTNITNVFVSQEDSSPLSLSN